MKSYLITDPKYYSSNEKHFQITFENVIKKHSINYACFRDKTSQNFQELATVFCTLCKDNNIEKYFINGDYKLAYTLKASGVHLTSTQFNDIKEAKKLQLEVIISTHNEDEIELAIKNGADYITYSPIFHTPNKGKPKGISELERVTKKYNINLFALGGIISDNQIEEIKKQTKTFGFASIRYFVE